MAPLRGTRQRAWLGVVLGSALLAGCAASTVGTGAPAVSSAAPSATAPATPDEAATERAVPLYYVTDTPAGPRLAREFRRVPVDTDPGTAAVTALFAAPTGAVPDHRNTWPAGSALAAPVTHVDGVVTVALTARAVDTTPVDPILAVQQLVYTVTGALGTRDPVQVLVAGSRSPACGATGSTPPGPWRGRSPRDPVLVGIDDPADGASVRSPVRISGRRRCSRRR
jgi:spore germination protein GerM